jgi:hypothetical protein
MKTLEMLDAFGHRGRLGRSERDLRDQVRVLHARQSKAHSYTERLNCKDGQITRGYVLMESSHLSVNKLRRNGGTASLHSPPIPHPHNHNHNWSKNVEGEQASLTPAKKIHLPIHEGCVSGGVLGNPQGWGQAGAIWPSSSAVPAVCPAFFWSTFYGVSPSNSEMKS